MQEADERSTEFPTHVMGILDRFRPDGPTSTSHDAPRIREGRPSDCDMNMSSRSKPRLRRRRRKAVVRAVQENETKSKECAPRGAGRREGQDDPPRGTRRRNVQQTATVQGAVREQAFRSKDQERLHQLEQGQDADQGNYIARAPRAKARPRSNHVSGWIVERRAASPHREKVGVGAQADALGE